jgi:hypothetical protein
MKNYKEIRDFYLCKPLSFFDSFFEKEMIPGVPDPEYLRIPVHTGNCLVLLMIWGKNAGTAIHGHAGFDGTVKVIKGTIKEENYKFVSPNIELISSKLHSAGEVLCEEIGTIHAIINQDETWSVTLHIYNTKINTLAGTVLYDPEKKRIGVLNDLAKSSSWNEDPKAFGAVIPFDQFKKF